MNPHKPNKFRKFSNNASKFRDYLLNGVLRAGLELLANLMGLLARFQEKKLAMTADIEETFLPAEVKLKFLEVSLL